MDGPGELRGDLDDRELALFPLGLRLIGYGGDVHVVALLEVVAALKEPEAVGVPRAGCDEPVVYGLFKARLNARDNLVRPGFRLWNLGFRLVKQVPDFRLHGVLQPVEPVDFVKVGAARHDAFLKDRRVVVIGREHVAALALKRRRLRFREPFGRDAGELLELQGDRRTVGVEVDGKRPAERGDDRVGILAVGDDGTRVAERLGLARDVVRIGGVERPRVRIRYAVDAGFRCRLDVCGDVQMIVHGQGLVGEDAAVPIPGLVGERHDGFLGRFAVDAVDGRKPGRFRHAELSGNVRAGRAAQRGHVADFRGRPLRRGGHDEAFARPDAGCSGTRQRRTDHARHAVQVRFPGEVEPRDFLARPADGNGEGSARDSRPLRRFGLVVGKDRALEHGRSSCFRPPSDPELRGARGLGEEQFRRLVFGSRHAEVGGHAVDPGIGPDAFLHVDHVGRADDEQDAEVPAARSQGLQVDRDLDDTIDAERFRHDGSPICLRESRFPPLSRA